MSELTGTSPTARSKRIATIAPIFVVGPLRSGTSLLYALLNRHPEIALMYECDVWDFPRFLSGARFRGDWCARMEFYNASLSRHRLMFGDNLSGLKNVRTPEDLYRAFGETKDARLFGEKSPFYCARLRQLAGNHPGCSFILLWRDPVEIYRSMQEAASRGSYFFRRRGMLSRLIYYQEQMIREAAALVRAGHHIYHVTYPDLVDRTEQTCRGICKFLYVEFDEKMLDIKGADLTAVYEAPQHEFLRRGVIERRSLQYSVGPDVIKKLERFHNRWSRLRHKFFNHPKHPFASAEPSRLERLYHHIVGLALCGEDSTKRVLFEFLPLPWLRTYRQGKAWLFEGHNPAADRVSLVDEMLQNKATILLSLLVLAVVGAADYLTGFLVSLLPFYFIPASILALVINWRWGTIGAIISTVVWACVQNIENPFFNTTHAGVWLWNAFMRFLVVEIVVLLLGRIRVEIKSKKTVRDYR